MKVSGTICFVMLATLIFSVWVVFALLVINPYLYQYIPGYKVGNPCGWELVALAASIYTAYKIRSMWAQPCCMASNGTVTLRLSTSFTVFLLAYLAVGILIFLWQYSIFSASFG